MKLKISKRIIAAVLGAGLMLGSAAWAGQKSHPQVEIDGRNARGSTFGARNGGSEQFIGCGIIANTVGATVFCGARDANGRTLNCTSDNRNFYRAVQAMTAYNRIAFSTDGNRRCTLIAIDNSSVFLP